MSRIILLLNFVLLAICWMGATSCSEKPGNLNKVSVLLMQQIELRKQQIEAPSVERLKQMKDLGMILDDLQIQRVFVYIKEPLTPAQEQELTEMGIRVHQDSWVPRMGDELYGFFIAEMPINKLGLLATKEYVIMLDTAESRVPLCKPGY